MRLLPNRTSTTMMRELGTDTAVDDTVLVAKLMAGSWAGSPRFRAHKTS